MRRREFLSAVGAATVCPRGAWAQSSAKTFRIGVFPDFAAPEVADWFSREMKARGWTSGRDLIIEQFGSVVSDLEIGEACQRVVASKPDLILTISTAHALALQRVTSTIPIVMMSSGYPVEAGVADSLSKPGRNVTGNALYAATGVWGKMLQLLRDAKPNIERVGVLWTYATPVFPAAEIEPCYAEFQRGARSFGQKLQIVERRREDQLREKLAELEAGKPDGLLLTSLFTPDQLSVVTQFAVESRLPTIIDFDWTPFSVSPLPLMSYGPAFRDLVVRAAASADKILRGANPGEVPIQNPDRFELVANLKTAQAIGLLLPDSVLMRADRVND